MNDRRHVVVTGCEGFIGKALVHALAGAGYVVWGIDRACASKDRTLRADLLDEDETRRAFAAVPRISAVAHAAALAHGERLSAGQSYAGVNGAITASVLRAVEKADPRLIFLSSVAVYGEDRRGGPVGVDADLRPATDYGQSKKLCEEMILQSKLTCCDILRLAPVYDEAHMNDVRKRVFLPGLPRIKLHLAPPPLHSLCHVNTVTEAVLSILDVDLPPRGRVVMNVADPAPYDQREIASWFPGRAIRLPVGLARPLYHATRLLPPKLGYRLRCTYWKLMKSNVYHTDDNLN